MEGMSVSFSNNGKINDLTVEERGFGGWGGDQGMCPHSDCFQSIHQCIYREWMDDASRANLSSGFWEGERKGNLV